MARNGEGSAPAQRARSEAEAAKIRAAIANLKRFQATHSLGGLSVRDMIEEGRKH